MNPRFLQDLPSYLDIRDVAFQGEQALLFTVPPMEVWRFCLESGKTARLHSREQLLAPLRDCEPALTVEPVLGGGYPLLAVSPRGDALVTAFADVVLLGWEGERGPWRFLGGHWGEYYPALEFSPEGECFAAFSGEGEALAFSTPGWQLGTVLKAFCGAWHPTRPVFLGVDSKNQLSWFDIQNEAGHRPIGRIDEAGPDPSGPRGTPTFFKSLAFLDEKNIVVLVREQRATFLDFWLLEPLERLIRLPMEHAMSRVTRVPGRSWLVLEGKEGAQVWDADTLSPISEFFSGQPLLRFSPSGHRFITGKRVPHLSGIRMAVSVWSVE